MKLGTVNFENIEQLMVGVDEHFFLVSDINKSLKTKFPINLFNLINQGGLDKLEESIVRHHRQVQSFFIPEPKHMSFEPLYRNPSKIWGIGLNYAEHASDLEEKTPDKYPASFMKSTSTIIGHNDTIKIPKISERTTGEAELGIIIGKKCKDVSIDNWKDVVLGYTTIIDMTAEDILKQNPRYLTLSKNFDTFFSFGPILYTKDEFEDPFGLEVSTVLNGKTIASNIVSNMKFPIDYLVSFHSSVMPLQPGDIISTGTPRAVALTHGDTIQSKINGFETLTNTVIDLKL